MFTFVEAVFLLLALTWNLVPMSCVLKEDTHEYRKPFRDACTLTIEHELVSGLGICDEGLDLPKLRGIPLRGNEDVIQQ